MNRNSQIELRKVPEQILLDIGDYYGSNETEGEKLCTLGAMLDAYLKWNGIIGYTEAILTLIEATQESSQ